MDTAKPVTRRKSIALNTYITKEEKSQINNLSLHLKQLGKKNEQHKPKSTRKKENNKDDSRINKTENKNSRENQSF